MRDLIKWTYLAIGFFINSFGIAQTKTFTAANAHSHNDYLNAQPFSKAYKNDFGSIEVDIFPVNGTLCVAHHKNEIQPQRTFKRLYLEPLLDELNSNNNRPVKLLIDIKENYELSLELLIRETEPLKQYLSTKNENKPVTILISGERPAPPEYKNYPGYIFFDDDLKLQHDVSEWERVGQVSLPFTKFSEWKGEGAIDGKGKKLLKHVIDSVHKAGKTIRFWAAPDNEASWILQMKLGVDLIGTDKIDELAAFLRRRSRKK
ncbi:MAG: phosphatidylinositol-specific phospholipase C/glycerophosphodiester phosphodiesterase family protein [Chitinophagaceae bacterium]